VIPVSGPNHNADEPSLNYGELVDQLTAHGYWPELTHRVRRLLRSPDPRTRHLTPYNHERIEPD